MRGPVTVPFQYTIEPWMFASHSFQLCRMASWQFAPDGQPRPVIHRLVQTARGAGMSDERLYQVLVGRTGISGDARLADALRDGRDDYVLSVVRSSS